MRILACLLLALTAGALDLAAQKPALTFDRERFRIPSTTHVLKNGLTLIVNEDHSTPIVAVNIWYHVGSRDERRGRTGFAHLFEHFFFNGSEHHPHGFREAMDDLGATNRNGTTNSDRTNFYEDVPLSGLERTLFLEADRMGFLEANISQAMLERERGVVKNEKRQGENQPYGRVWDHIESTIYPYSHPYSWSTIGSMEDLDAATLEDIKEWYRTYYGPNNAVISLSGDITPQRAIELVTKYFGDIPPGPPLTRLDEWIPVIERNVRQTMVDRVPQTRIYRLYHAPAWGAPELPQLGLFAGVLSGSKSSPLDRRIIYDKELATGVTAFVSDGEIASLFGIMATVAPGVDPAVVEREIDDVVAKLISDGPSAGDLERAKSRELAQFVRGIERLSVRANVLSESMTYGGTADAYLDYMATMSRSTAAEVRAAAKKWIGEAHHYTMVVEPQPALAAGETLVDRSTVPSLGEPAAGAFPAVQRATMRNGLQVMLLERHSTPLVNMTLAVRAGTVSDTAGRYGLASMAMDLLEEGTTTRDAFRIADELDALGASVSTSSSADLSTVRLGALSTALAPALEIYADVVRNPAFAQEKIDLTKQQVIAGIAQERAEPTSAAMRLLPGLLFGPAHPYAHPGIGYDSTVRSITRDDLRAWHRTWFRPNNATLVVTGDITMPALMPALEKAFGTWQRAEVPARTLATAASGGGRMYLVDRPGAQQSVIVAAHTLSPTGGDDDLALEVAMRNFGGIATSRLNRNLRLEKHWSYGAFSGVRNARGPRLFTVIAPVQTDKTKESLVEVSKEIRGIAGERPIGGEEFASTMRNATSRLPARFETLGDLERAALDIVAYERPDSYWTDYGDQIRRLDEAALAAAARANVRPDEITWIVVGDLSRIEPGIRELGYGEIVRVTSVP